MAFRPFQWRRGGILSRNDDLWIGGRILHVGRLCSGSVPKRISRRWPWIKENQCFTFLVCAAFVILCLVWPVSLAGAAIYYLCFRDGRNCCGIRLSQTFTRKPTHKGDLESGRTLTRTNGHDDDSILSGKPIRPSKVIVRQSSARVDSMELPPYHSRNSGR